MCALFDAQHTATVPGSTRGSSACRIRAVPTRSTWIIGHHSPIVGEIPAACARVRNGPRP